MLQKDIDDFRSLIQHSHQQRSKRSNLNIRRGPVLKEQLRHLKVALSRCLVEWRPWLCIGGARRLLELNIWVRFVGQE